MLESLKITRQLSEQRVKALGLRKAAAGLESESSTEEERATANEAFSSAVEEQIALEGKYRAALDVESAAAEAAALVHPGNGGGFSSEQREFVEIEGRASFAKYLDGQFSRAGKVDGAEAELRSAVGDACGNFSGLDNVVPWSMILTPDELRDIRNTQQERAVVGSPGNIGAMQDPIIKAIFAGSTAAFLGTNFTSAQVGQQLEYVLTPTGATFKARDGAQDAGGSLTSTLMQPRRLTSAYLMQVEQMAEVRGLEAALRSDLPRGQASALDKAVINGGAAPEFPKGILNSLTAVDMTALATFDSSIAAISKAIDGQYALTLKQVKIVVNQAVLQFMYGLTKSQTAVTLVDYLMMQTGGIMCTSNMPTHAKVYPTILCKTGPGRGDNAVGKIWGGGIQIIRDEITQAAKGQVIITARSLYDFAVVRTAGYYELGYKIVT